MIRRLKVRYLRRNVVKDIKRDSVYVVKRNTFGGVIYPCDFEMHLYMRDIADRIASDLRFDKQCRRNTENRNKRKWK